MYISPAIDKKLKPTFGTKFESTMSTPEPFEIHVSDELLRVTRAKLESARFPDELQDVGWEDGTPTSEIRKLRDFWLHSYDWREEEKKINAEMPQFKLKVPVTDWGQIELHFVHKRSSRADAMPLLFTHGCMMITFTFH
jgi:hypothetical protein